MKTRPYLAASATVFSLVAVLHLSRLVFRWPMIVGGWPVPAWISVVGLVVTVGLAWWGFRLAREAGGADR